MKKQEEQLTELKEIRQLMERSSRFLSLSGLAGLVVGAIAITGVTAAYLYLGISPDSTKYYQWIGEPDGSLNPDFSNFLIADVALVLFLSLFAGFWFAKTKAQKQGLPFWDATAKRALINLAIPILAGAVYCFVLLYHGQLAFIAPATLIFYGLALLNTSKYTIDDIGYLGLWQLLLGLLASFFIDYGLLIWAVGFGLLHMVYGLLIYNKYEK
ncbi:MAG: hypothetical protein RI924_1301 [Bacteroidota bacterium]|jgi:hypothetical protein